MQFKFFKTVATLDLQIQPKDFNNRHEAFTKYLDSLLFTYSNSVEGFLITYKLREASKIGLFDNKSGLLGVNAKIEFLCFEFKLNKEYFCKEGFVEEMFLIDESQKYTGKVIVDNFRTENGIVIAKIKKN